MAIWLWQLKWTVLYCIIMNKHPSDKRKMCSITEREGRLLTHSERRKLLIRCEWYWFKAIRLWQYSFITYIVGPTISDTRGWTLDVAFSVFSKAGIWLSFITFSIYRLRAHGCINWVGWICLIIAQRMTCMKSNEQTYHDGVILQTSRKSALSLREDRGC